MDGYHGNATIFKLRVALYKEFLQVDLYDEKGEDALKKPFSQTLINASVEHQLNVKLNNKMGNLVYRVDSRGEVSSEISTKIPMEGAKIRLVLGAQDSPSITGCFEVVAISTENGEKQELRKVTEKDVSECGAEGNCATMDCGHGNCLQLEVPTCDCYGTEKSGPNCRDVFVDAENDKGVWYVPLKEDRHPKRISMQFRTATNNDQQSVVLSANISQPAPLRVFINAQEGTFLLLALPPIHFQLDQGLQVHKLLLTMDYETKRFELFIDDESVVMVGWKEGEMVEYTQIVFGQSAHKDGERDLGFTGCLHGVYVDHMDILEKLHFLDPRVASDKQLASCESKGPFLQNLESVAKVANMEVRKTTEAFVEYKEKPASADVFPVPAKERKLPKLSECEKADETQCRHGAKCVKDKGVPRCQCTNDYTGEFCQFSVLPRTCAEAAKLGLPKGATKLDLDGSGPLERVVADCENGKTTVIHDMPELTSIRDSAFQTHSLFVLSYRDFSGQKLSALIGQSEKCEQRARYECNGAPFNFAQNHTWFYAAADANKTIQHFGATNDFQCACAASGSCIGSGACNCDSPQPTADEGVFTNKNAGITKVIALHRRFDIDGRLSLSPLTCQGYAGATAVRLQKTGSIPTAKWDGSHLSFQFRTADESALLASIQAEPRNRAEIKLENGRFLTFMWKDGAREVSVIVETQHRLNDTKWHLVRVEAAYGQLMLHLDGQHSIVSLGDGQLPRSRLWIGAEHGTENGLLGCIRSVAVNNVYVDLEEYFKEASDVSMGCEEKCTPGLCHNEAKCIEDFGTQTAKCICKYPHIHLGANCELDLNERSDVSFHGGFLRYDAREWNPLTEQIVVSARTDQPHGLILFAHDHNHNFLQVHISEEVNVTLTLNNRDNVFACSVTARPRSEFSDMEWIQIVVTHHDSGSILSVGEDLCSISAERALATERMDSYHYTRPGIDFVTVPIGLQSPTKPEPLLHLFVGGVERDTHSQKDEKRLTPVYQSEIPDLLGCIRGLRVGSNIVDMRDTKLGYRPKDDNLVRPHCSFGCDQLQCEHGGHCAYAWRNYDPSYVRTTCDCSRTSYRGATCALDDGLRFDGNSVLEFQVGEILKSVILDEDPKYSQLLKFAFSARVSMHPSKQHLATIRFKDPSMRFELILNRNGTINAGAVFAKEIQVITFAGNFTDGFRHFVVVQFSKKHATAVVIDSLRRDFDVVAKGDNLDLYTAERIEIGGQPEEVFVPNNRAKRQLENPSRLSTNYEGCISNLLVDYQRSQLTFEPFGYLGNSAHPHSSRVRMLPNTAERVKCADFYEANALPSYQNTVEFPNWSTNFARRTYNDHAPLDQEDGDGDATNWWLIGLLLSLLLITLLTVGLCCYCACKDPKPEPKEKPEEHVPLRPQDFGNHTPPPKPLVEQRPHNKYEVPEPDTVLDTKERASWAGSVDDDFEGTLTEGMDEDADLPTPTAPMSLPPFRGPLNGASAQLRSPHFSAPSPPPRSPLSPTSLGKL
ncbi:unnamed protein product, partial [Mesorhabditis spiculigera]